MDEPRQEAIRPARNRSGKAPLVIGLLFAAVLVGGAFSALFSKTEVDKHKHVTQITLVVPPPPPPPKPEVKPPDPPKVKEEVKLDEPKPVEEAKPTPQDAPPPGPLGLDANGSGPGDGFGLAARQGGHDITMGGSGGGGLEFTTFANSTARFIAQALSRDERLRGVTYRVEVRIWLKRDGKLQRYELVRGTGDQELDRTIRDGLAQIGDFRQSVPTGLPQPMRVRVTSSDA